MAKVAIILDQMFEDSEFRIPYDHLKNAGHQVEIVGTRVGKKLSGKHGLEQIQVEKAAKDVKAEDYNALVVPGGYSPDTLRMDQDIVRLTREVFQANKPLALVCHGGSMLVEADIAAGRTLTSWPSIRTDLLNAGAHWVDREVVEDGNLITSRKPDDLEAFSSAILRQLQDGIAERIESPPQTAESAAQGPASVH